MTPGVGEGVRSLYDGMVRIVVTPTWGRLLDFETISPSAVEELLRRQAAAGPDPLPWTA